MGGSRRGRADVEEAAYIVRTPILHAAKPPTPQYAAQQMIKGLLSVTTV